MASESPDNVRPERAVALVGGRYRLDGVLGRGGFGVVHRATDELLQRVVAVKEVRLPISGSADERDRARERVLREARAAGRLQHPGAVSVLDVIDDGDLPWIIMEFVEGRALSRIITGQGPRPVDETCRIGISLAYALEAAHRLGIVHRDVKPSNVLITPDGRARLTDFGIAVSHGDPRLTSTGMVLGSPAYLPPERARGDAGGAGGDRWALGATLFTTVEGSPPFGGGDPIAVLGALMRGQRQPFRLAGPLAPLLDDLMAPQSTSRPPLSLVRRRLREILDHSGDHRSFRSGASTTRGSRSERPQRTPAAPPPPTSPEVTPPPAVAAKVAPVAALTTPTVPVHAPRETAATPTARADSAVLSPADRLPADGADSPSPALAALPEKPSAAAEAATRDSQPESLVTNDMNTAPPPPEPTEISTTHNADDKRLSIEQHGAPVATPPQSIDVTAVMEAPKEPAGSGGGESPERAGTASTIASVALVEAAVIDATATLATAAALHVVGAGTTNAAAAAEQPTEALPTGGSQFPEPGTSAAHREQTPLDQATRSTSGATVEAGPAATTSDPDPDPDAENIDPANIDSEHPVPEHPAPEGSDPAPAAAVHAEPARARADQPEPDQAVTARPTPAGQAARPRPTGPLERIRHADRMRALGGIPARARLVRRGPGGAPPAGPAAPPADVVPASVVPTSSEPAAAGPAADPGPLPYSASIGAAATPDGPPALAMRSRLGQNWPRLRPPTATTSSPPPLAFRLASSPAASPPAASGPDTFPPAASAPAGFPTRARQSAPPRPRPAGAGSPFTPAPPRDAASAEAVPAAAEGRGATPPPGDGSPRRWRRIAVASVIGTLVAAAVIILLVVLSRPGSDTGPVGAASAGRGAATASGPNAPPPGGRAAGEQDASRSVDPAIVPAVPVAHDTGPALAPPGWSSYADPDAGWSVAYPTGWRRQAGPGGPGNVDFMDPVSGSFLRVGSVRDANTSAIVDWQRNEAGFDRSVQDYRRVRLASSDGGDGTDQADWEFTYRRSDGVMVHVLNRGAIRNGHGYALYWHTREDLWLQDQPLLRQLFETFRPGP